MLARLGSSVSTVNNVVESRGHVVPNSANVTGGCLE